MEISSAWSSNRLLGIAPPQNTLSSPSPRASDDELMQVSKQFESIFIGQLFKEMKKSVESINENGGLFRPSMAEGIFKDMLFDQYAQDSAQDSPLGLAKIVYDSLKQGERGTL